MMRRQRRRLALMVVLSALIAPAVFDHDSFPLATYPMYSRSRGDVVAVDTANGVSSSGQVFRLSLEIIGDIDDPLIVESAVRDAIGGGAADVDILCGQIAARLPPDGPEMGQVEVVTETHNVVDHAAGRPSLVSREVHATCEVEP